MLPLVCGLFIAELYRKSTTPLTNVAWAVAGIVYVAVPLALLVVLPCVGVPGGGFVYRPARRAERDIYRLGQRCRGLFGRPRVRPAPGFSSAFPRKNPGKDSSEAWSLRLLSEP